ncbi:putative transcription factor Nin-like family [Helianthus annuus]|uniref:Transcription factor Nin-like family n=1 Tax=Helianthus annuus TaxID=4232 RepID=A0A9K3JP73_HELAN|nr:putative transcription factor Nin-like family [Helianthus annuus]
MSSELSEFLQFFSPNSLHHWEPKSRRNPWVFWSESEGCENNSSSADLSTLLIHDKIRYALSNIRLSWGYFAQFWAPVKLGGRWVLSTSGQPFAVDHPRHEFAEYRLYSVRYKFNIDLDKHDNGNDPMIIRGGAGTAFLNCLTNVNKLPDFLPVWWDEEKLNTRVMVPICFPSQGNCLGVLEFTLDESKNWLGVVLLDTVKALKKVGLDVFYVQDLIPYAISGLEVTKDEIEEALKVVCETHNLALAQVWIPYEDTNNAPFPYSLEDSKTKRLLAIKLTGYLYAVTEDECNDLEPYFRFGDITPRAIEHHLLTLQDYKARYISKLGHVKFIDWDDDFFSSTSALAICLRSNDSGDFNYAFEFMWTQHSNYVIHLEALLLTLKRCLPGFKFASGAELGDELDVIVVKSSTNDETQKLKICQEKSSSPMSKVPERGKKPTDGDFIAPSKVTCKTTPKVLPREVIEKQFGKTMKDAAKDLNVSLSTLKRKVKELKIPEWPGPNVVKRNRNDSSIIQVNTNEEESGAIEDTSTVNLNKNELTIKAQYEDDMIKFNLPISQVTFVNIKKEIGKKLELSDKTYKLKYLDEDGDWITLKSDEEMADCIKSSRKSGRIVVRMRVVPSPQPI